MKMRVMLDVLRGARDYPDSLLDGKMPTAHVNGIDVRYTVAGSGPWITLAHALGCRLEMWDEEVKHLSKWFTVLAYDARGHGKTSAPAMPYTLDMIADDLKGLLDHLGIARTHWIGLSMGGVYGLAAALKYPGIFETLVLADTSSKLSAEGIAACGDRVARVTAGGIGAVVEPTLEGWFKAPFRTGSPRLMARVASWIRTTPPGGYIGCSAAMATIDVTHRLGEITVPCMVIVGADDSVTPPAMARLLDEHLPRSELVEIPNAGHLSNLEQSGAFNAALSRFLRHY
jgi:3-oxoadipate enol-lactonase